MRFSTIAAWSMSALAGGLWGAHVAAAPPAGARAQTGASASNDAGVVYSRHFPRENVLFVCKLMPSLRKMRVAHVGWLRFQTKPSPVNKWVYFTTTKALSAVYAALRKDLTKSLAAEEWFPDGTSAFYVREGHVDLVVMGYGKELGKPSDFRRPDEPTEVCVSWLVPRAAPRWKNGIGTLPTGHVMKSLGRGRPARA